MRDDLLSEATPEARARALKGALWGTALGDALGLPYEGLSARQIARQAHAMGERGLWRSRLFVSDDTEQSALLVESVLRARGDPTLASALFRRALGAWFLRLPFGVGLSTLRACFNILLGRAETGVRSAGNGAAMRAASVGVLFSEARHDDLRRELSAGLAKVTHTDPRAVQGAVFAAELAALCARVPRAPRQELASSALEVVDLPELRDSLDSALRLAATPYAYDLAPNTGYVVSTLALSTWAFVKHGETVLDAIGAVVRAGGDTDSAGAIVGSWLGALHGPDALPHLLLSRIDDGPFGPGHLASLAEAVVHGALPNWSRIHAWLRNVCLFPVVLTHGLSRLVR